MIEGIIDRIYEAAIIPDMWEKVLIDLNDAVGTKGGIIFTHSEFGSYFAATPSAVEYSRKYFDDGFSRVNSRIPRARQLGYAGFLTEDDMFSRDELARDPLYQTYIYPAGLGWFVGTMVDTIDGDEIAISFDGAFEDGPIPRAKAEWLDTLRPHLARALSMTARANLMAAVKVAEGLGVFGLPAGVINRAGKLLSANETMNALIPAFLMDTNQGVRLRHGPSDKLLRQALIPAAANQELAEVMSVPVPATEESPASVVHIIPVCGHGRDIMRGGLFILVVSQLSTVPLPATSLLRGLFDLTPTEARVARVISGGIAPRDIGNHMQISSNTVKVHLKSIYAKTGVDHHAALVRLLSGTPMPQISSES